ncbi:MAG: hypothetical protein R2697_18625 [Ilumatobacteraceae bacterium]
MNDLPLPADLAVFGEVGLGTARSARWPTHPRRLAEAARLGFRRVIGPRSAPDPDDPRLTLLRVATLPEALAAAGLK